MALLRFLKKSDMFTGKGSLEGWIRRIMVNTSLDYLRSIKNMRFTVDVDDVQS